MKHLKLFEAFSLQIINESDLASKFYTYSADPKQQEVIIRNDTIGSNQALNVPMGDLRETLDKMGGPKSILTRLKGQPPFAIDFAANCCLFEPGGKNTGLFKFMGKTITPRNSMQEKNFGGLLDKNSGERNGVLFGPEGKGAWKIVGTSKYSPSEGYYAIQNGPILVLDGKINSEFNPESPNKLLRNGIGIDRSGRIHFVISKENVTFYELASYFLNDLKCDNALYSDGIISQAYINGRYVGNTGADIAPIIMVKSVSR